MNIFSRQYLQTSMLTVVYGLISGLLSSYSLFYFNGKYQENLLMRWSGTVLLCAVVVFVILHDSRHLQLDLTPTILSVIFALFTIVGESFSAYENPLLLFKADSIVAVIGYAILFRLILIPVCSIKEERGVAGSSCAKTIQPPNSFILHRPFLISLLSILLCWFFVIVLFFPGIGYYDSLWQLSQFYGYTSYSSQHPVFSTLVIGVISFIGSPGGANGQYALYCLGQTGVTAVFLSYCCAYVYKFQHPENDGIVKGTYVSGNRKAWLFLTAFSALNPLFPIYSMSILKDVPYAIAVGMFSLLLFDKLSKATLIGHKPFIGLSVLSLGALSIFRAEGFLVVLICSFLMFCVTKGATKHIVTIAGIIIMAITILGNFVIFPVMGVFKPSRLEVLSMPLQQITREMKIHPDSFTAEERIQLKQILKPEESVETVGENYNPGSSDNAKSQFRASFHLKSFISIWGRHFMLHPITYISATLNSTYGYIYPFRSDIGYGSVYDSFQWFNDDIRNTWHDQTFHIPDSQLVPNYPQQFNGIRQWFIDNFAVLYTIPILNLVLKPAAYVWLTLISISILIKKRRYRPILSFISMFIVFIMCLLSPINESIRYALPLVFTAPFLLTCALLIKPRGRH